MSHGHAGLGESTPQSTFYEQGRFGRLFPTLPPFAPDTPSIREALVRLGARGGPMDAEDVLTDPIALITDPGLSVDNPNNPAMTAGLTFFGQFVDHDMTFDPTSSLARRQDPESIRNFRIPALDLDSVYGGGPGVSRHLYDAAIDGGQTSLLTEEIPGSAAVSIDGSARRDLPRNSQNTALLGDPRNDEHLILAQFHLAMLRFHNRVVEDVRSDLGAGHSRSEIFAEAQRIVRWHYQWIVLHEFLERTVGVATRDSVLAGPRHFSWRNMPYIPVEFSVAAYRFGHSQVRPSYRANFGTSTTVAAQQFFALIFDPDSAADSDDPSDLRGGTRAARRFVDWQTFFDFGDGHVRPNKKIDTTLSSVLFNLRGQPQGEATSLATRNLLRSLSMKVPSGQRVARAMGLAELANADLDDLREYHLHQRTPLWFYVLREAQVQAAGARLGEVGGRIVAEVLIGLVRGDSQSYLRQEPDWTPTYGSGGAFTIVDLLRAAGVVAAVPPASAPPAPGAPPQERRSAQPHPSPAVLEMGSVPQ